MQKASFALIICAASFSLIALMASTILVVECTMADTTRVLLTSLKEQMSLKSGSSSSSSSSEEQEGVVLTFPVFHRKERKRGRLGSRSVLGSNSTDVLTLHQNFGQYFAAFQLGTPPVAIAVIIDTGSELLWIQCQPCVACGTEAEGYGIFMPNKSSTFTFIECSDITSCPSTSLVGASCTNESLCQYYVDYVDLSSSTGYLSKDTLRMGSPTSPYSYKDLIFGCGLTNEGVETRFNASGMMGLDRGPLSLISQLGINVFRYCLPNRVHTTNVTGYLTLGKLSLNSTSLLAYTPMIQNMASNFTAQFYYINMTGISINDVLLNIPSSAFSISANGNSGGTIIDSGTTLTYFVDEAYTTFANAFSKALDPALIKIDCGIPFLCYEVPLSQNKSFLAPKVTLHFDNMLNIDLDTDHSFYLYYHDTTYDYMQMTYMNSGSIKNGGRNIIGNYQQQNFIVEYDIANSLIGFGSTTCDQGNIL